MSRRALIWIGSVVGVLAILVAGLVIYAKRQMGVVEPMVRQRVIEYLSTRFDAQVELAELHVRLPQGNMFTALFRRNEGLLAEIDGTRAGDALSTDRRVCPLCFRSRTSGRALDLRACSVLRAAFRAWRSTGWKSIFRLVKTVPRTTDHPNLALLRWHLGEARIRNARLTILPKNPSREPLKFDIRSVDLEATGDAGVVKYRADLTNPKPPGDISSTGMFGPWEREDPGETPLSGTYDFKNADLSVFPAIAGILHSTGNFSAISVHYHREGRSNGAGLPSQTSQQPGPPAHNL